MFAADRLMRVLAASAAQRNAFVPIWSCKPQDKLVSLRLLRHDTLCTASPVEQTSPRVSVAMLHGLPQVTVPLPSRSEPCVFTLKPVTHTVGDFLAMLRHEDAGIDRAVVRTPAGVRVASTTSVQTLLKDEFHLVINDTPYVVVPPASMAVTSDLGSAGLSEEELRRMGDVRALVGQLYETLNVEEHQTLLEKRLVEEMEALREELGPLEREREELARAAEKRSNNLTWLVSTTYT
jgi:hypothetical protein